MKDYIQVYRNPNKKLVIMNKRINRSTEAMQGQYISPPTACVKDEVEHLLKKYEDIEKNMIIMDDYDGGQMHIVRLIIADLKGMMWWTM